MNAQSYNLGFVSSELFPVTRGGAGVLLHHVARALLARGHRVHILLDAPADLASSFGRYQRQWDRGSSLTVWPMQDLAGPHALDGPGAASWYQRKARQWFLGLAGLCRQVRLDVVEFPDFYGWGCIAAGAHRWAGFEPQTRFVVRAHSTMEQIQEQEIGCYVDGPALVMHEQERLALLNADAVISPSPAHARLLMRQYGLSRPPVIGPPAIEALPHRPRAQQPDAIVFVGRLFHVKGADTFVDAAVRLIQSGKLNDNRTQGRPYGRLRFVLIGYDSNMAPGLTPFKQHLQRRIPTQLQDRFQFCDHVPPQEVSAWLARAICYVCPSRLESFAYTVHEAKAAGAPVILTDIDAFKDYFRDGDNCLMFDGSAGDLARQMGRVISDASLGKQLQQSPTPAIGDPCIVYETLAAQARGMADFGERSRAVPSMGSRVAAVPAARRAGVSPASIDARDHVVPSKDSAQITAAVIRLQTPPAPERAGSVSDGATGAHIPAVQAIRAAWPQARIIFLQAPNGPSAHAIPLLGRLWEASDDPITGTLLLLCLETDRFDPQFLAHAARALLSHDELGFVAPSPIPGAAAPSYMDHQLDTELALWPITQKQAMTRSVLRTPPGIWLGDLFDRRIETYGEIDYLWRLGDQNLQGFQWPHGGAVLSQTSILLEHPAILQSMLLRGQNPRRMAIQSRYLAQTIGKTTQPLAMQTPAPPTTLSRLRKLLRPRR